VAIAQALHPDAQLIAVEPLEDNIRRMQRHLSASEVDRISIVKAALGTQSGRARLWRTPDAAYASLVKGAGPEVESVDVEVMTLDEVWARHGNPPVSLIKIDVEGAELEALQGASRLLAIRRPALLIEIDDASRLRAIESLLAASGYRRSQPPGFEPWNYVFTAAQFQ
jgi:FkbM family methyltransferase